MALLVGLTGSMGSGKTTVAGLLKSLGAYVIDADEICRHLVEPRQPAWQEIVDLFGSEVVRADETLDRAKIADIVFHDPEKRKSLEKILHPRVFAEETARFGLIEHQHPDAVVIVDAALLIESGNYRNVDKVVVVACDPETQIRRLMEGHRFTREEIENRLKTQMTLDEKARFADYIVQNNSTLDDLKGEVEKLYRELKTQAESG